MDRRGPAATVATVTAALVLGGCASYTQRALEVRDPLARGDAAAAEEFLLETKPGGDGLPYLMELGLVLRQEGEYIRSNEAFEQAEVVVDELFTRSISKEALAFVTSDETVPYDGEMWERVLVHYYRAMNYIDLGLWDDALVECRKINHRLKVWVDASEKRPAYSTDAFAQYLTALLYEASGDVNDAWVSLRLADSAYVAYDGTYDVPPPTALKRDLLRLARLQGFGEDERRLAERWPDLEAPPDSMFATHGEVIVFWEDGFIPAKIQNELFVPILKTDDRGDRMTWTRTLSGRVVATPHYEHPQLDYLLRVAVPAYPPPDPRRKRGWATLSAGDRSARSEIVEDLEAIARRGLEDRMGIILFRTILRGLAKYGLTKSAEKESEVAGVLVNLFTAAAEKADTRSWITLPREIHVVRLLVAPGEHDLQLDCRSGGGDITESVTFEDVTVGAGEVRFLSHRSF